jgi:hypothetical protein
MFFGIGGCSWALPFGDEGAAGWCLAPVATGFSEPERYSLVLKALVLQAFQKINQDHLEPE